jgi:hypothetical protein
MSESDTPRETCETCYGLGRVDAVYAPCPDCELTAARELVKNLEITVLSLMMENKTVTEQRDRLAEAVIRFSQGTCSIHFLLDLAVAATKGNAND